LGTLFTNLAVRVAVPDHPFVLIGAHPANPEHGLDRWLRDGQALAELASAHTGEPLVVAGDLNATAEHLTLRELKARAGLTDTATGGGWHPTFPANAWYPPLIQIDHVLVSSAFSTTAIETFRVAGTDHSGLMVGLAFS
jgi:endonuclease/exonuclease/phosphatase (EEP) superfamily protein YafD